VNSLGHYITGTSRSVCHVGILEAVETMMDQEFGNGGGIQGIHANSLWGNLLKSNHFEYREGCERITLRLILGKQVVVGVGGGWN